MRWKELIGAGGVIACAVLPAVAEPTIIDKACIFEAAKNLPAIAGLQILRSATGPVPPEAMAKLRTATAAGDTVMLVDLDVQAAGQAATFEFVCRAEAAWTGVTLLGITK